MSDRLTLSFSVGQACYARVYASGPNAFWYKCAHCGGKGYTEDGYDVTYANLSIIPTVFICEACYNERR
jgi:hypothetical protein